MNFEKNLRRAVTIPSYWSFLKFQLIPTHKITYLEWGDPENDRVLICVHGLTRNANDFDYIAEALKNNFRIISIDMAGRGGSDWLKNKNHYNYHTYIKDILLFMKALGIKSAYWLGTSMGGLIGMCLATYYPRRIQAMVLNDIGPEMPNRTLDRIRKYSGKETAFDAFEEAEQFIKIIFKYFGIKTEEHWRHITETSIAQGLDGKYRLNYDPGVSEKATRKNRTEMLDLWYLWKKVKCPVMLIHGAKSDILLTSTIDKMKKYRDFDLYTVDEAGHAPALVYEKDIDAIKDWLVSH